MLSCFLLGTNSCSCSFSSDLSILREVCIVLVTKSALLFSSAEASTIPEVLVFFRRFSKNLLSFLVVPGFSDVLLCTAELSVALGTTWPVLSCRLLYSFFRKLITPTYFIASPISCFA